MSFPFRPVSTSIQHIQNIFYAAKGGLRASEILFLGFGCDRQNKSEKPEGCDRQGDVKTWTWEQEWDELSECLLNLKPSSYCPLPLVVLSVALQKGSMYKESMSQKEPVCQVFALFRLMRKRTVIGASTETTILDKRQILKWRVQEFMVIFSKHR